MLRALSSDNLSRRYRWSDDSGGRFTRFLPRRWRGSGCAARAAAARSPALGASISRSCPRCVFGNAITSRIESAPAIIATMRSRPKAMPPCGGAPYCSASSRKPNFVALVLGADAERAEHLRLHVRAVDPHRAAADFPAVQHHVVGLGERVAGVGREQVLVAVLGRGERMVARRPGLRLLVVLEHREIDHPQRLPARLARGRARGRPSRAARPARR